MNAKITIAGCMLVAAMNHASAAIVDADTELRAFASSVAIPGDPDFTDIDERTATFSGYGSSSVSSEAVLNYPDYLTANVDVTASVQPHAIGLTTYLYMSGSPVGRGREGTGTATVNFSLSEAGVWSAKPIAMGVTANGLVEAVVSLLREGQEVYYQDCSLGLGQFFCNPDYEDEYGNIIPVPEYAGRSLELQQGDYTLLLTHSDATGAQSRAGGTFHVDLQVVPVPAALPLFLSALAAFGLVGWRRR